jgi:hypothetical protein
MQSSALARIQGARADDRDRTATKLRELWSKYISTARDKALAERLDALLDAAILAAEGMGTSARGLAVIGESGAGKTQAVRHLFEKRKELQPFESELGKMMPLVSFVAPSPCTLKQLGREILHAVGYKLERDLKEHIVWEIVRRQLKQRQVVVLHIDEMQHAVRTVESKQSLNLSETLKNLMQQNDWKVSLVLSGLPSVAEFLEFGEQLRGRFEIFPLLGLRFPDDLRLLQWTVTQIGEKHAGLNLAELDDEFCARLCHAGEGQFGRCIKLTRHACEDALRHGSRKLGLGHFAAAYSQISGCDEGENIFTSANWETIEPSRALEDRFDHKPVEDGKKGSERNKKR